MFVRWQEEERVALHVNEMATLGADVEDLGPACVAAHVGVLECEANIRVPGQDPGGSTGRLVGPKDWRRLA